MLHRFAPVLLAARLFKSVECHAELLKLIKGALAG